MPSVWALPAGVSAEILLRRPDVIEAEYDLRAANADIGVASARLFPSISLTGLLGFASNAIGSLFDSGSFSWSAGGVAIATNRSEEHTSERQLLMRRLYDDFCLINKKI